MKFINSSAELAVQEPGLQGMLEHIERCGRVSYKSEDRITEDSAPKFVSMLMDRGHTAPLEHGTMYLVIPEKDVNELVDKLLKNPYTFRRKVDGVYYITTNYRVIVQLDLFDLLDFMVADPTVNHIRRYTFKVVCSRGVSHELVRHRALSFVQESSRYCNYAKGKHNGELLFIIPSWVTDIKPDSVFDKKDVEADAIFRYAIQGIYQPATIALIANNVCCETCYMGLITEQKKTPQEARDVLTNGVKTELYITGTLLQWKHFLSLRSPKYGAKGAHPDMAVVGDMIYDIFKEKELL